MRYTRSMAPLPILGLGLLAFALPLVTALSTGTFTWPESTQQCGVGPSSCLDAKIDR
jgi:hypothetical protein